MKRSCMDGFKQWVIEALWYGKSPFRFVLFPFSVIFWIIVGVRRFFLVHFRQRTFPVPIIVVGNLTVGGVGKTPFVIALAKQLQDKGVRVGIVSRGYGARHGNTPYDVGPDDLPHHVGDEPLLLARKTGCPVVIASRRTDAVQYLIEHHHPQCIISDDGLQHYAMGRAIEIVLIDGIRGVGNGFFLPAGPLREGVRRLKNADYVILNQAFSDPISEDLVKRLSRATHSHPYVMTFLPGKMTSLLGKRLMNPADLLMPVAAVAGIGHPQRFFSLLESLGLVFKAYPYADHHEFKAEELNVKEKMLVMTEKDAVKCFPFATDNMYFLPIEAKVEDKFWQTLWSNKQLQGVI